MSPVFRLSNRCKKEGLLEGDAETLAVGEIWGSATANRFNQLNSYLLRSLSSETEDNSLAFISRLIGRDIFESKIWHMLLDNGSQTLEHLTSVIG